MGGMLGGGGGPFLQQPRSHTPSGGFGGITGIPSFEQYMGAERQRNMQATPPAWFVPQNMPNMGGGGLKQPGTGGQTTSTSNGGPPGYTGLPYDTRLTWPAGTPIQPNDWYTMPVEYQRMHQARLPKRG